MQLKNNTFQQLWINKALLFILVADFFSSVPRQKNNITETNFLFALTKCY